MARHCRAMSSGYAATDEARQTLAKRINNNATNDKNTNGRDSWPQCLS